MGEYFRACFKNNKGEYTVLSPWAYKNGSKIMEHSYLGGNSYMLAVEKSLYRNPCVLAWVGDYTDEDDIKSFTDVNKQQEIQQLFEYAWPKDEPDDYGENGVKFKQPDDESEYAPFIMVDIYCYVVNHTKKQYIDLYDYSKRMYVLHGSEKYFDLIHPLPLLTAVGHGKGGGCYYGIHDELIGTWAGDVIEIVTWDDYREYYEHEFQNITDDIDFSETIPEKQEE